MRRLAAFLLVAFCVFPSSSYGKKETPPDVMQQYEELLSQLDMDAIGESIKRLEEFRARNAQYEVADAVEKEIKRLRREVKGRFHRACDIAGDGEFDRAEKMLVDLATYFPETKDGRLARAYLEFDFYMFKARRFLESERPGEAEQALRELLKRDLSAAQAEQVERMLDTASNMKRAREMSAANRVHAVCKTLQMALKRRYMEYGEYPTVLSLDRLDFVNADVRKQARMVLSAIEGYTSSGDSFSFVAVGRDGNIRFRVTSAEVVRLR